MIIKSNNFAVNYYQLHFPNSNSIRQMAPG